MLEPAKIIFVICTVQTKLKRKGIDADFADLKKVGPEPTKPQRVRQQHERLRF